MTLVEALVALAIVIGLVGVLVPILPGSLLVFVAVLVWALTGEGGLGPWTVVTVVALLLAVGAFVKYVVPGRRLHQAGIPASTQWVGAGFALVGFFVVPVVGLVLGFVLGVYVAERRRLAADTAWPSTVRALRAVGLSILIELIAALLAATTWVVGVVVT